MQPQSSSVRMHNLSLLESEQFDVLVIGGGVTGAGVALDAIARGYNVALVEKVDFASGTSSKSTKLVHGGIRYLPEFDFALVREALVERSTLLRNAPYLVEPVGFVLPLYKGDRHPVGIPFTTPGGIGLGLILDIGLWLYDLMAGAVAGRRGVKRHRRLSRKQVMELAPVLVTDGLKDGFLYYDAQTNDTRLTLAVIRTAAQYGATIANYAEVTSFVTEQGKVVGVHVRDRMGIYRGSHGAHIQNVTRTMFRTYNLIHQLGEPLTADLAQEAQTQEVTFAFNKGPIQYNAFRQEVRVLIEQVVEQTHLAHASFWQRKLGLGTGKEFVLRFRLLAGEAPLLEVISVIADAGRVGKETIVKRGKLLLGKRVF